MSPFDHSKHCCRKLLTANGFVSPAPEPQSYHKIVGQVVHGQLPSCERSATSNQQALPHVVTFAYMIMIAFMTFKAKCLHVYQYTAVAMIMYDTGCASLPQTCKMLLPNRSNSNFCVHAFLLRVAVVSASDAHHGSSCGISGSIRPSLPISRGLLCSLLCHRCTLQVRKQPIIA